MSRQLRLAIIAPYAPHRGIDHAGGSYLFEYVRRVGLHADVSLLVPNSGQNRAAVELAPDGVRVTMPEHPARRPGALGRLGSLPAEIAEGISIRAPALDGMEQFVKLAAAVQDADVVEIQFGDFLPLVEVVRQARPDAYIVAVEHDVFTDVLRWTSGSPLPWPRRLFARARLITAPAREVALLNRCDLVQCFSEKDARTLRGMGVTAEIRLIDPVIPHPSPPPGPSDEPVVLFSGSMWRSENYLGAMWLVRDVWPAVRRSVAAARLVIAGASPPPALRALVGRDIEVTGRVPDIDAYLSHARVLAAAIHSPAGTKFKILAAMAHAVPVVATSASASGVIDRCGTDGMVVADSAPAFAEALIGLLRDPHRARELGFAGRQRVHATYNFDRCVDATTAHYETLRRA